jgi:hypothetical protein
VATILQFIHGLRGSLHVTLEEGTCAAWLHDLLKPHVASVVACDPRKNALRACVPRRSQFLGIVRRRGESKIRSAARG